MRNWIIEAAKEFDAMQTEKSALPTICPHCQASMDGGPIPEDIQHNYSPPYRWSRRIAIYDRDQDRTVAFQCPDCGKRWEA